MEVTFLIGGIFSPIARVLGLIMNAIYAFFNLFGIQNIALSIIVFTIIMKMLMLPLTIKQQRFAKVQSRMQPEIQKIQAKYKGKKDEVSLRKMQEETQAVYQKYGASQLAGCLPLLIMLPIMFALYEVINNIPNHVTLIQKQYQVVADAIMNGNLAGQIAEMMTKLNIKPETLTDRSSIINVLAKFTDGNWNSFKSILPEADVAAMNSINYIKNANVFFGLNIADSPSLRSITVVIPVLSSALQFLQGKMTQVKSNSANKDNPAANTMGTMNVVMPIMSGFFCLMLPIGIGLYWIMNSLVSIIQQYFVDRYFDKLGIDEMVEKSQEKMAGKYAGKYASKNASKTSGGSSLADIARKQTKSIENKATDSTARHEEETEQETEQESGQRPTSISDIANLLKNRNEKGDK